MSRAGPFIKTSDLDMDDQPSDDGTPASNLLGVPSRPGRYDTATSTAAPLCMPLAVASAGAFPRFLALI
jgi:hypothetical protein